MKLMKWMKEMNEISDMHEMNELNDMNELLKRVADEKINELMKTNRCRQWTNIQNDEKIEFDRVDEKTNGSR